MSARRVVVMALVGVSLLVLAGPARAEQRSRGAAPAGLSAGEWQGIVDEIRERPYRLEPVEAGGYEAANPAQGWTVAFKGGGADVRPTAADWTWGLRFVAYGYPGAERSVSVSPRLTMQGTRADYHWDAGLTEWLRNGPDGLKQTFVLAERPGPDVAAGPLGIALRVAGSLKPRLVDAGQGVSFADAGGVVRLTYRELVVSDAMGQRVPAWFEVREGLVRLRVDDRESLYPLTVDPIAQQAYLKASNTDATDQFGLHVAISGDTVVVGAHSEDSAATGVNSAVMNFTAASAGAAYVFVRSGTTWSQQAYLKASNTGVSDGFGGSVAISGDTAVVAAVGEGSAATGVDGNQADNSAPAAGAAYVFVRSGTTWSQQAYLKASNTEEQDRFGESVTVSGDTTVVGAPFEASAATGVNGNQADNTAAGAGAAYVFARSGTTWSQQAYLKASNTGGTMPGFLALPAGASPAGDKFGSSVAISGDTVLVGAPEEASAATGVDGNQADNTLPFAGAAYVFGRSGGVWSQQAYLKASNTGADGFGSSVAVSGDTFLAGAPYEASAATGVGGNQADNTADSAGAAYAFIASGSTASTTSTTLAGGPTTSTTLPGCEAVATYASIDCRLDALIASLNAAQDLGRLKTGLVKAATKARTKKQQAEGFVATGKKKPEKKAMKKAVKALSSFLRKVGSRPARKLIPQGTRQMLTDQATPILADMKTLLGTL